MKYKYLTEDEKQESLASALREREREHHNYELNKINYEHMLDSMSDLPEEWPESLKQYQGLTGEKLASAVTGADFETVMRLQFRDRVKLLLATTIAEQAKSEAVYNALQSQIPEEVTVQALTRIDNKASLRALQLAPKA